MARQFEGAGGAWDELLDVVVIGGSSVTQLHSAGYRNPRTLPPGPVLVVGCGNSGFQAARVTSRAPARQPAAPARSSAVRIPVSACPVMRSRHRWLHLPLRSRPGAHRSTW